MVTCNHPLDMAKAIISVIRPASNPPCDPEMTSDIKALFVTDTNEHHAMDIPLKPPTPIWSNIFDYYDTNPDTAREYAVVDPSRRLGRRVKDAIQREGGARSTASIYEAATTFLKMPMQGEFDNLHLAPRMEFNNATSGVRITDIAMAPFCAHDCLHTHFRWGAFMTLPKYDLGFSGRRPYMVPGAPLVPLNQTVAIRLTSSHGFEYIAEAAGPITAGAWTVFYHHGSAYSLSVGSVLFRLAREDVWLHAAANTTAGGHCSGGPFRRGDLGGALPQRQLRRHVGHRGNQWASTRAMASRAVEKESAKWRSGRAFERTSSTGPSGRGGEMPHAFRDDERVAA